MAMKAREREKFQIDSSIFLYISFKLRNKFIIRAWLKMA